MLFAGQDNNPSQLPLEIHSKIKFCRRGMVAMSGDQSFFITLADCNWLDSKYTIFGTVKGPSIYTLVKISELAQESEKFICDPLPTIYAAKVTTCPFDDIVQSV